MAAKSTTIILPPPGKEDTAIVKLLSQGMSNNDMAVSLKVKEHEIISSLYVLRLKYNCKNSTELVALFLREGFIN